MFKNPVAFYCWLCDCSKDTRIDCRARKIAQQEWIFDSRFVSNAEMFILYRAQYLRT